MQSGDESIDALILYLDPQGRLTCRGLFQVSRAFAFRNSALRLALSNQTGPPFRSAGMDPCTEVGRHRVEV
jgi:hypothetical protein